MNFSLMQILTLLTGLSGGVLLLDKAFWKTRERDRVSRVTAEIIDVSRTVLLIAGSFLVVLALELSFAQVLVILTAVAGITLVLDKLVWKSAERDSFPAALTTHIDYSRSFFPVLVLVLVIRSFVFEPFRIPSGSMNPTLLNGDFVFVKKFSYGLRLPVSETRVFETGSPERGDVVVFRLPNNPRINYIKRVIGLPGDTIAYERHRLTVNGELVDIAATDRTFQQAAVYDEDLSGRVHDIVITEPRFAKGEGTYQVPQGHYFMMGDNRSNSKDSRYTEVGFVAEEFLVGEATRIWMHWVPGWNWPGWSRIGTKIQ